MITIKDTKLIIDAIKTPKGDIAGKEIDLMPYQGQYVRVYLDNDLNIVVNPRQDCYWQLAELYVPYQTRDEETDKLSALDLSNVELITYVLPEV